MTEKEREEYEVVNELSNMLIIQKPNGKKKTIARTTENILLYKKGWYDIIHSENGDWKTLEHPSTDEIIKVKPIGQNSLSVNYKPNPESENNPIVATRTDYEDVLHGLEMAVDDEYPDYTKIKSTYEEIKSEYVDRNIVNKFLSYFPNISVIQKTDGWEINGLFKLTWKNNIFLIGNDDESYEVVRGSDNHVEESDSRGEFLKMNLPEEEIMEEGGHMSKLIKQTEMTHKEAEFLSKANWLVNYRENKDDDIYWDTVEEHVYKSH